MILRVLVRRRRERDEDERLEELEGDGEDGGELSPSPFPRLGTGRGILSPGLSGKGGGPEGGPFGPDGGMPLQNGEEAEGLPKGE